MRSDSATTGPSLRDKVIGLGERSLRKSYYPQLQQQLEGLEQAQKKLADSEARYRSLVENINDVIFSLDVEGIITYISPVMHSLSGFSPEQVIGQSFKTFIHPEDLATLISIFEQTLAGKVEPHEFRLLEKTGTFRYVRSSSRPLMEDGEVIGLSGSLSDISEHKKLEEQLRQSQKMESIGRLAGGVAHDFNNMLSVILGGTELLRRKISPDDPAFKYLDQIAKAADRSREITRQLLAFSRKEIVSPKPVNLNSLIIESEKMLARLINEDIKLTFRPATNLWTVMIDPSQIDQILMNLAVNARDAMPDGGSLTIETANIHVDESYCQHCLDARSGSYVQLTISDTGIGMSKETREQIFEPFFTTKAVGQGTGLGLATVYGIVTQNNGFICVYSEPEQGSAFKIYLPRLLEKPIEESESPQLELRGSGTVLLVEDEEMLLMVATSMLEEIGYTVIQASNPIDALAICQKADQQIDLILTDVVMPGMNGKVMVDRIRSMRPTTKVLFMSGYTADIVAQRGIVEEGMYFIQKPLNINQLNEKLGEILGSAPLTSPALP